MAHTGRLLQIRTYSTSHKFQWTAHLREKKNVSKGYFKNEQINEYERMKERRNKGTNERTNERPTERPSREQRNGRATDIAWWRDQTTNENERPRHPRMKKGTDELLLDRRTRQQTKTNRGKQRLRIYKIQIAQLLNHWEWLPNNNIFPARLGATSQQPWEELHGSLIFCCCLT